MAQGYCCLPCAAVKGLYVMGGAEHKGNITTTAEFNFHVDPEAAHLVLKKVGTQRSSHAADTVTLVVRGLQPG